MINEETIRNLILFTWQTVYTEMRFDDRPPAKSAMIFILKSLKLQRDSGKLSGEEWESLCDFCMGLDVPTGDNNATNWHMRRLQEEMRYALGLSRGRRQRD